MVSAATDHRLTLATYVSANGGTPVLVPNEDGTKANITVTYPKTDPAPVKYTNITSISVTGLEAPVFGATPDTTVSVSDEGARPTVSWSPSVSTFADNTPYTATITIQNASEYVFNSTKPTVTLNGNIINLTNVSVDLTTQRLTVTHNFPKTEEKKISSVSLSSNTTSGTVPLTVKFTYKIANATPVSLDYGDKESAALSYMNGFLTHTYTTPGTYTAKLKANNASGDIYDTIVITVNKIGLAASFTASSESGTAPMNVLFVDKSAGSPTQWIWDFGGQGSSMLQNPSFTFTKAGTYIVKLTVIDSAGATNSYSKSIYVNDPIATTTPTVIQTNGLTTTSLSTAPMGEVVVPAPIDIIKEFVRLFYSLFNPASYLFF
ncbi:MAG TPA: PKD domain-containing protein [Methanocorpusculum sp.]|nr:PKD domain-containing protein [Methanocorpusculum sp.]